MDRITTRVTNLVTLALDHGWHVSHLSRDRENVYALCINRGEWIAQLVTAPDGDQVMLIHVPNHISRQASPTRTFLGLLTASDEGLAELWKALPK